MAESCISLSQEAEETSPVDCPSRPHIFHEFEREQHYFKEKTGLSSREEAEIRSTDIDALRGAIKEIQDNQNRSRRLRYMRRLEPFIRAVEDYSKVIDVFANTQDMIAFVWGPMKMILQIVSTYTDALNMILDTYEHIGESIPHFLHYEEVFREKPYMLSILTMVYRDLLEFHALAMKHLRTKVWKQVFLATWRGFNVKIERIREDLQRHQRLLDSEATIVQFEEMRALGARLEKDSVERERLQQSVHLQNLVQWLSAHDSSIILEACTKVRSEVPGTGGWLTSNEIFQKWFNQQICSIPLLWLSGMPGAGKTILASLVIDEARTLPDSTVAYYFCRHGTGRNKFLDITKGLLAQLVSQNSTMLLPKLFDMMSSSGQATLSEQRLAKSMLEVALRTLERTYIILDGLDECCRDDRKDIARFFKNLVESSSPSEADPIRCLFVCQDDGISRRDFAGLASIKITEKENASDMRKFAQTWQRRIEVKFGLVGSDIKGIGNIVSTRAQGMFLYAQLVLQNLYDQSSRSRLMEELRPENFPQGLEDVYERILMRIFDPSVRAQHREAQRLLSWLVCAKRPLKWHEIQGAVSIDLDEGIIDLPSRKLLVDGKWLCGSLIEVQLDNTLCFVHSTVKTYLIASGCVKPPQVEIELATLCLAYLNFEFSDDSSTADEVESMVIRGSFAFLEYAVFSWASHLEAAVTWYQENEHRLQELTETTDTFLSLHYKEPKKRRAVPKRIETLLKPFRMKSFYDSLAQAFAEMKLQKGPYGKAPSDEETTDLWSIVAKFRAALEKLASRSEHRTRLEEYYGTHWYRCPRMNCQYFHEGFERGSERDRHVARHERAFLCHFQGCVMGSLGFVTSKDLEQHMLGEHGIDTLDDDEFPEPPKLSPKPTGEFNCELCPKRFTRKHNLKSHMRTHANEKPFQCQVCGKAFVRRSDCVRHEEGHSGEKKHECGGLLKDGVTVWGCGMKFARADKLLQHLNSDSGKKCQKPLRDEERRERQAQQQQFANLQPINRTQALFPTNPGMGLDVNGPSLGWQSQFWDYSN